MSHKASKPGATTEPLKVKVDPNLKPEHIRRLVARLEKQSKGRR